MCVGNIWKVMIVFIWWYVFGDCWSWNEGGELNEGLLDFCVYFMGRGVEEGLNNRVGLFM